MGTNGTPRAGVLAGSRPEGLGDTGLVTVGAQQRGNGAAGGSRALEAAGLDRLRSAVSSALDEFLDRQSVVLAAMDATLVPLVDEVRALAAGGKRLRPAFAYWGWRGARDGAAEDG